MTAIVRQACGYMVHKIPVTGWLAIAQSKLSFSSSKMPCHAFQRKSPSITTKMSRLFERPDKVRWRSKVWQDKTSWQSPDVWLAGQCNSLHIPNIQTVSHTSSVVLFNRQWPIETVSGSGAMTDAHVSPHMQHLHIHGLLWGWKRRERHVWNKWCMNNACSSQTVAR